MVSFGYLFNLKNWACLELASRRAPVFKYLFVDSDYDLFVDLYLPARRRPKPMATCHRQAGLNYG